MRCLRCGRAMKEAEIRLCGKCTGSLTKGEAVKVSKAYEDVKAGRVYTFKEAKKKLGL